MTLLLNVASRKRRKQIPASTKRILSLLFYVYFLSFLQMTVMWPKHQQEKFTQWECKWHSSGCFGYGELPKLPLEIAQAAFPPMGLNEISCIVLQPSSFLFGTNYDKPQIVLHWNHRAETALTYWYSEQQWWLIFNLQKVIKILYLRVCFLFTGDFITVWWQRNH